MEYVRQPRVPEQVTITDHARDYMTMDSDRSQAHGEEERRNVVSPKPFLCDSCDKRFTTQKNMRRHHDSVHANIRPYTCPVESCDKKFSRLEHLSKHRRTIHEMSHEVGGSKKRRHTGSVSSSGSRSQKSRTLGTADEDDVSASD